MAKKCSSGCGGMGMRALELMNGGKPFVLSSPSHTQARLWGTSVRKNDGNRNSVPEVTHHVKSDDREVMTCFESVL